MEARPTSRIRRMIGWLCILSGSAIVLCSPKIVFPGLELLLGIEQIVGSQSVWYLPDGSYMYTNPSAAMKWIALVALVGVTLTTLGCVVLLFPSLPRYWVEIKLAINETIREELKGKGANGTNGSSKG
jgi:hypothetical protein